MRRTFAKSLLEAAKVNKDIILVSMDLGYGMWDEFRNTLPNQFYNVGASEQAGLGICVGLALEGKIPVAYSITTFLLCRPFETIRTYINHEKIPVILAGSGRDKDYSHDGWSHDGSDDKDIMNIFKNINSVWPETKDEIPELLDKAIKSKQPYYINLRR